MVNQKLQKSKPRKSRNACNMLINLRRRHLWQILTNQLCCWIFPWRIQLHPRPFLAFLRCSWSNQYQNLLRQPEIKMNNYFLVIRFQIFSMIKVSKNQNDFMKTSFLPKTNKIIVRIFVCYIIGQKSWQ